MNRNLFLKELKREFRNFVICISVVVSYIILTMAIFKSLGFSMAKVADLWGGLPEGFLTALNMSTESWSQLIGFYATYFVFYIPLVAGGFSVVWGLKMITKEEQHKTAEFLLTRPLSRDQVMTSKLLVVLIYILIINVAAFVTGLVSCMIVQPGDTPVIQLSILHLYGLVACIVFTSIGLTIGMLSKRGKTNVGLGIGILMGTYLFDMMIKVSGKLDFLLYLTPFKYIDTQVTAIDYHLEGWRMIIPLTASIILVAFSFWRYRRRDVLV